MNNIINILIWSCAAEGCGVKHSERHVMSVFAAMDPRTAMPRPCPPEDWNVVEGLAYCGRHNIELTATVRTPATVQDDYLGRRLFVVGLEKVRLRNT